MNKLSPFAKQRGVETWNGVNDKFLTDYVKHFEGENAGSTIRQDVITIAGVQKWLLEANHLSGVEPVNLKLHRVESQSAYCYTSCQFRAMAEFCQEQEQLGWLADIIVALACTGLRISELATIT